MKLSLESTAEQDAALQRSLDEYNVHRAGVGEAALTLEEYAAQEFGDKLNEHLVRWDGVDQSKFQEALAQLSKADMATVKAAVADIVSKSAKAEPVQPAQP